MAHHEPMLSPLSSRCDSVRGLGSKLSVRTPLRLVFDFGGMVGLGMVAFWHRWECLTASLALQIVGSRGAADQLIISVLRALPGRVSTMKVEPKSKGESTAAFLYCPGCPWAFTNAGSESAICDSVLGSGLGFWTGLTLALRSRWVTDAQAVGY